MKTVYSVGQVNRYVKNMFIQDYVLRKVYVKGEVSNCKYHTSGLAEAQPLLEESLKLAEPDDCVTIFAEHAYELIPILEAIGTPFARRIIPLSKQFVEARKICRNNGGRRILLTKRECEVMDLVTEGHTAEAISKILFVSHSTVKKHIASAYDKLGVNKKADAIAKYKKMMSK